MPTPAEDRIPSILPSERKEELLEMQDTMRADAFDRAIARNMVPWDTLLQDQRIERMRGILKDLQHTIEWQSRRFGELSDRIAALEEHGHADGHVMIPVGSKRRDQTGEEKAYSAKVPGWF